MKGYSLHIGLNRVNPNNYHGWSGPLNACENDARSFEQIAEQQGFITATLLTKKATKAAVLTMINDAAQECQPGDIFFLTNSSHGGQLSDYNADETDRTDETICLYDGMIADDELNLAFCAFRKGVRILVISDSCHSGTVTRLAPGIGIQKSAPASVSKSYSQQNPELVQRLRLYKSLPPIRPKASVMLLSACKDSEVAYDGSKNGLFTGSLLQAWAELQQLQPTSPLCNYTELVKRAKKYCGGQQTPAIYKTGATAGQFSKQKPFQI